MSPLNGNHGQKRLKSLVYDNDQELVKVKHKNTTRNSQGVTINFFNDETTNLPQDYSVSPIFKEENE